MTKTDNGWIDHDGGKCPDDLRHVAELRFRDGSTTDNLMAGWWSRYEWGRPNDIIAYRVKQP